MKHWARLLLICLSAGMALACSDKEAAPEPVKAEPTKAEPTKAEPAAESKAEAVAADSPAAALKDLGEALKAGMEAQGSQTGVPCEDTYNGIKAMFDSLPQGGEKKLPEKDQFLKACGELPEGMQKCISMGYAMQHQEECAKAKQDLSPELLDKVKTLMGK